jgi:hypothetical protein
MAYGKRSPGAGPTLGSLSSSSALAEFMSTSPPACSDLPVAFSVGLGVVAAGELGDFGGDVVCAATGVARSKVNPIAGK